MNKKKLKEQVDTIRQAFGYINQFKDKIFVIKIYSSLINHPSFSILINDIVLLHRMGIRIVLIPGTRDRIDDILTKFNIAYSFKDGVRISSPESIPFIKMASFDVSNKVMTQLAENNTNAIIGNWVKARSIGVLDGVDYQSSGRVATINTTIVSKILEEGMIPIFPNIGWNALGKPYNLSSNELAIMISKELHAAKLFFLTDFGGIHAKEVVVPPDVYVSGDGIISQLTVSEVGNLIDLNASIKNNHELQVASFAHEACRNGVNRVHIIDGRAEGMLLKEIFSNRGFGTMIYANQHENIRPMDHNDIPFVLSIMETMVEENILIPRTQEYLLEKSADYIVYEVDGTIHGCAALHIFPGKNAEIASVAVDDMYANLGIGKKLISFLIDKAVKLNMKTLFVFTTQTADWFSSLGFSVGTIDDVPIEKKNSYNTKRNSRILVYPLSRNHRLNMFVGE